MRLNWRAVLAVLAVLLGLAALIVALTRGGDGTPPKPEVITFHVNEEQGDGAPTQEVSVPAPVAEQTARTFPDKAMRDESPPLVEQVAPGQLTAAQQAAAQIRAHQAPLPTAGASAGFTGCLTRFVQNQSSRNGVRPQVQVAHYTVSANRPGWSDVLAVLHLFDTRSFQASSNFIIDREGHCYYIVPIEAKAWTQAGGNPFSISYEVINTGSEVSFMDTPGYAKLRSVMQQVSRRTGIPMRRGAVSGCVPSRTGIVQHKDGSICWGGHHDIAPFSIDEVVRIVSVALKPISKSAQAKCRRLNANRRRTAAYHRRFGLPPVPPQPRARARRSASLRASLRRGHYLCKVGPPGRRGSLSRA